jgi:predicted GNAT superfamily acetyltransferase
LRQPDSDPPLVRPLTSDADLRACLALQHATWGEGFSEAVPPSLLRVVQRVGGVAAGAFDASGELLGFVFGITGVRDGRIVHWSDLLAVRADARGRGIGRRLKEYQREEVRRLGGEAILWSFDPLVARNAHLNLVRLGARVVEYVVDMYGVSDSVLHRGLGTDRLVVEWPIEETGGPRRRSEPQLFVEVPPDIAAVQATSLHEAAAWRERSRQQFLAALGDGYRVVGFECAATERCHYLLARERA